VEGRQLAKLKEMAAELGISSKGGLLAQLIVRSTYREQISWAQSSDVEGSKIRKKMETEIATPFRVTDDGSMMMGQRLYVPNDETVKWMVLQEAHESKFSIHPGSTKMYWDLKHLYWWPNMKRKIVEYMSKCKVCQQIKVEHQKPTGILQPLQIPDWKWKMITMDFMLGFPQWKKGNDAIWVIVDEIHVIPTHKDNWFGRQACQYLHKRCGTTPWDSDIHCLGSGSYVHLPTLAEHNTPWG